MDPEQIYTEVLQAEQQKGSSGAVAEGRAKSARQRALNGSPHPTEPKWWPGAQPHLEGGGEEPAADEEGEASEAEATEAPEAEVTEAEAPQEEAEPAADTTTEAKPDSDAAAAQAPAEQGGAAPVSDQAPAGAPPPAAAAPGAAQQAAPAAAQTQEAPAAAKPAGVSHGTPTGNRLRPEDGVSTEAQFEGQRAMYERRKLIDELVATGVPAVAAEDQGRRGSPALALLYILIPILAIFVLVNQEGSGTGEAAPAGAEAEGEAAEGGGLTVVAEAFQFDTDTLDLKADAANEVKFENKDTEPHNIAIYKTAADGPQKVDPLFSGEIIEGGQTTDYTIEGLKAGEYYFQCDVHPNMNGTATVK